MTMTAHISSSCYLLRSKCCIAVTTLSVQKCVSEKPRHSQVNSGPTWVYTVETTFVDTLKTAFPPSTHFTSAPFCSTHTRGIKWKRRNRQLIFFYTLSSIYSLFLPVAVTLVLLASLMAKYPGGRLHETGMLNSWDDRRPSLSRGSHE